MTEESPPSASPSLLRRAAALVLALLLAVGVAEGALRLLDWQPARSGSYLFLNPEWRDATEGSHPMVEEHPTLFWRLRPGTTALEGRLSIGSSGYRTPEFDPRPPEGVERVVCIGDSITFGFGIELEDTWPRRLEAESGGALEVISAAVPGYTSHQGGLVLDQALAWRPDIVIVAFGAFNDWVPAPQLTDDEVDGAGRASLRVQELVRHVWRSIRSDPELLPADGDLARLATRDWSGPRRVPLPRFRRNLVEMVQRARAAGARPVLLVLPLPEETVLQNPVATDYAAAVRRVASEHEVPLVDAWADFERLGLRARFLDFCHPDAVGHRRIATSVAPVVRRLRR